MKLSANRRRLSVLATVVTTLTGSRADAQLTQIAGAPCVSPPPLHCPAVNCSNELIASRGNAVLPKSNRPFFLDYPCDLKPGETVTFVLNLHGAGSMGNWQRHYFPIMDLKDKYRLVVATPSSVNSLWNEENDDPHLRNIVTLVFEHFGPTNIRAFWIAGHSQGGEVARRLAITTFYRDKLTGLVSLSGGRLGSKRAYWVPRSRYLLPAPPSSTSSPMRASEQGAAVPGVGLRDADVLPDYPFSHIYSSGEYEMTAAGLPDHSPWAQKLGCQAQTRRPDVVDVKAGYVWDWRSPRTRGPIAGRQPRPGRARVFVYPECAEGRVVADVIRLDKGHTEGLEPNVTEAIVRLMMSAK